MRVWKSDPNVDDQLRIEDLYSLSQGSSHIIICRLFFFIPIDRFLGLHEDQIRCSMCVRNSVAWSGVA